MFKLVKQLYISNGVRGLYCVSFLCLMINSLFYHIFTFNYESYLNQQYTFVFWLPIFALVLLWLLGYSKHFTYRSPVPILIISIICSYICFSRYYSFSNEYFFSVSIITFACYSLYWLNHIKLFHTIIIAFSIVFLIQLCLGLRQLFVTGDTNRLAVTGSLQNSGVYAYYLVFNLPFFYWFCFGFIYPLFQKDIGQNGKIVLKLVFISIFIWVCYLVFFTQSRTALICMIGTMGYYLILIYKNELLTAKKGVPKIIMVLLSLISMAAIACLGGWLYNVKKLSAIGRMLGLDITWQNLTEHFWLGTGLGRFTWYYPQWQASYFCVQTKPKLNYFLSADESYIVFNDYLQLFTTIGILGTLVCCYGLYRFFKLQAAQGNDLLSAVKCTVFSILCSGFTSYPLHVNGILLLLGAALSIGFALAEKMYADNGRKNWLSINRAMIILCFFLVSYTFIKGYPISKARVKWNSLRHINTQNVLSEYGEIYPMLKNDGKFLTEYGTSLLGDSTRKLFAIATLEKAKQLIISRQLFESLTLAYSNAGRYEAAIKNQQFLVNYLPNKFLPRYELLNLYIMKNDTVKIVETAQKILQMPIKVSSNEVLRIQQNTQKLLKDYL